jgi:hypothetical protein
VHEVKAAGKGLSSPRNPRQAAHEPDLASASTATDKDASAALALALDRLPQKCPRLASMRVDSSLGADVISARRLASSAWISLRLRVSAGVLSDSCILLMYTSWLC